ncbi:ran GTPase-activating protein 1-like [Gigantopelta aegis]|uniref:ran GTPase-activating protein 1-like n=1 Tax=Gigantopelta aegis TaxID=1735272 RepID=UPI001B88BF35|nr:ran GTPase-activating protein 1-like [Gigantopelta aegis]
MSSQVDELTSQLARTTVETSKELSFEGRGLKLNTADDAKEIIEAIEKCDKMTSLQLGGNTLGVKAAEAIGVALSKHSEFQRARWSDMFTGRLKSEIPEALKFLGSGIMKAHAQLVELDLSDNAFGPNGMVGLVELLKSESCYSLKELRLNNNGLGVTGGKMLAESLLECHKRSSAAGTPLSLRVFVSGRGRLENVGATALSEAFKAIGTLEEVAMPQNGIIHEGISALADALAVNKQLRVLNLSDNTFTQKGAQAIAKALPHLQNLEVINFSDCLMKTEGVSAIADALDEGHANLKELILSGNEITKSGISAITGCLENKTHLQKLDLNENMLGEEGVELVQAAMEAIDKLDALTSLSDDEGSDEDDEDEDGEHNDDEEAEDDEEGDVVDDPELQVRGEAIGTPRKEVTAKDFLSFPSPSKLLQLGKHRVTAIKEELGNDVTDVEKVVETVIRISAVVTKDDEKTKHAACECADGLFQEIFKVPENIAIATNALLVQMGIIKGEDKKFKPISDVTGPLLVLEHAVQQSYFPQTAREILLAFVNKPHPRWESAGNVRCKLLETLIQF